MKRSVLVIGGGPAGLAAALRLSAKGYSVTLLEARDRLGGRSNGTPPVLFGCQDATRALLNSLGQSHRIGSANRVNLEFALPGPRRSRWRHPWLPGPLHTVLALAVFTALPPGDRWRILNLIERTWERHPALPPELNNRTADAWLAEQGQSSDARRRVWDPLTGLLLGDKLAVVSAASLVRTLTRHFLESRHDSTAVIPDAAMQSLLFHPMAERLKQSGVCIRLDAEVTQLHLTADRLGSVALQGGDRLTADSYVAALPHRRLCSLLPDQALTRYAYFEQLTRLTDSPAVRIDLSMDRALPRPKLILLAERTYHWVVARNQGGAHAPGASASLIAVGDDKTLSLPDHDLLEFALSDLQEALPDLRGAQLRAYQVTRNPHAFLSLHPGTQSLRPLTQSPVSNLLIAGGWTDTSWPDMLESAIVSGQRCAEAIEAQGEIK